MTRRGRARTATPTVRQLPWREVRNAHGPLPILDAEGVERIHDASIRVLEELGIEVWSEKARSLFAAAGASIDGETVRVGRGIVDAALASAPERFTLTPRNPDRAVTLGGDHVVFGLVAGPPADYVEPALDSDVREQLDEFIARRKAEIGDGEP